MRRRDLRVAVVLLLVHATGCGTTMARVDTSPTPSDVLSAVTELRIEPLLPAACPGSTAPVRYSALTADGRTLPVTPPSERRDGRSLRLDDLIFESPHAEVDASGHWVVDPDPLVTALEGIHLSVHLAARPEISDSVVLTPEYSCQPRAVEASWPPGPHARRGPSVVAGVAEVSSPFADRLLLVAVSQDSAATTFVLRELGAGAIPDFFRVTSVGSKGAVGRAGGTSRSGYGRRVFRRSGCGLDGRDGADGGDGRPGGRGGDGGTVVVHFDARSPTLAELVIGGGVGGPGGPGGLGGRGSPGGRGGPAIYDPNTGALLCPAGSPGSPGSPGMDGPDGADGGPGPAIRHIARQIDVLFASVMTPELRALLDYSGGDTGGGSGW